MADDVDCNEPVSGDKVQALQAQLQHIHEEARAAVFPRLPALAMSRHVRSDAELSEQPFLQQLRGQRRSVYLRWKTVHA
jgi:hypothetical protein